MLIYAIVMFVTACAFGVMAKLIYKGKTELIHDYHQTNVTDKKGYGRSFGKAMGVMSGTMTLSGGIALFGESVMWIAVAVLVSGFVVGIFAIGYVQKKYNGGVFG